jgi:hypothetical protein
MMTTYLVKGFSHKYPDIGVFIFVDGPDEADFSPRTATVYDQIAQCHAENEAEERR